MKTTLLAMVIAFSFATGKYSSQINYHQRQMESHQKKSHLSSGKSELPSEEIQRLYDETGKRDEQEVSLYYSDERIANGKTGTYHAMSGHAEWSSR